MGRGGFHGLATDHLDDVDFINIQPVIKASKTEAGWRERGGKEREEEGGTRTKENVERVYKSGARATRGVERYYSLLRVLLIRFKMPTR